MGIAKKITAIVLSSLILVLGILFLILGIVFVFGMIDLIDYVSTLNGGYMQETYGKLIVAEVFRIIACVNLAIWGCVTGGVNLGKAIKGRPAILNRVVLFTTFDFVGIAALIGYIIPWFNESTAHLKGSFISYAITMLILCITAQILSGIARGKLIKEGASKLAGAILLFVAASFMIAMMILFHCANSDIVLYREQYLYTLTETDTLSAMYIAFIIIGYFGIVGTVAYGVFAIIDNALAKRAPKDGKKKKKKKIVYYEEIPEEEAK